ncbi:PREDICTED: nuclear pore complex protein NUP98A-like isoform X1 [Nicotiana attenuata]|uniref:Nuclear pore complex protein nup98a n=1 Tax=Nicotiana attenuata TaxID=49451 RepID=A0A1J6KQI6_NICAT|nr:PREDICTED: nuclear pore complex protein NUP98A-like isoform X1 [Nicotiana attenuata]OIT21425.1 nuclear pore complex protein nup98a [Nicotiana attenuata]
MLMFSFKNNTAPSSGLFSSSNLFGSTSGIQQNGNPSVPFGTSPSSFGASSPSFSSINLFGSTSGIQQIKNSNGNPSVPQWFGSSGATSSASLLSPFGSSTSFGGTTSFNATNNATAFQTQGKSLGSSSTLPTFGKKYEGNSVAYKPLLWSRDASVSDSSIFGSYSFGQPAVSTPGKVVTTPLLKSSDFGKSAFGINKEGSRMASYTATKEKESKEKIQSICGMQTYEDKSHEELRFKDYQLGDKGQTCASIFGVSGTSKFGVIDKSRPFTSPVFNPSTVDQPFYSHCPNPFALKRPGIDLLPNENSSTTSSTPLFPKSQQSTVSHIFPPKTSFLNSDVSSSPWTNSSPFAPLKAASTSSTNSIFSPSCYPWALSTSSVLLSPPSTTSPCLVSPSPAHHFDQNRSFSPFNLPTLPTVSPPSLLPTPVSTTAPAQSSWQLQPTLPSLFNVPSTPSSLFPTFVPLAPTQITPERTPNIEARISPAISSQLLTENGQGVGHPGINVQQSYSPSITGLQPSPIMVPSETQPAVQVFVGRPDSATSVQYGISSLPVSDKTAPVRRRSSLIIRHSSLSRHRLPPQKYNPTSDKPKVPFFMDKENASGIVSNKNVIISRENPRDWVRPTTREFPLGSDSCRLSQLKHASADGMDDGVKVNDSCDKPNIAPEEKMHYDKSGHCVQVSLESEDVDAIMPKLQLADYYTVPPMQELISKEKEDPGFCCHVKDFVVGRHDYGSIKLLGETDVRNLDLDSAVYFNRREVIIYMDESKKPPVGQGLNKPAEITLLNVKCINKSKEYTDGPVVNKYRDMLVKKAMEQSAEFVSYDPVEGQWKFRVSHF